MRPDSTMPRALWRTFSAETFDPQQFQLFQPIGCGWGTIASAPRAAVGVRGDWSRCRTSRVIESGSKLPALQTLRVHPRANNPLGLRAISNSVARMTARWAWTDERP